MKLTHHGKMMVAAHRGDSDHFPENTMAAFHAALTAGVDMIETDVRMTCDGVLVLMHDKSVDRTTDGTGVVAEMTFARLRTLNAGTVSLPQMVPTLEELLDLLRDSGVSLNLEVKEYWDEGNEERSRICVDRCVDLLEQYRMSKSVIFNSFDAAVLEYIDEKYCGCYRLHGFYPYERMYHVRRSPSEYLYCACLKEGCPQEHYAYLLERKIEPWIGPATAPEDLEECFRRGARLVTSNHPAEDLAVLRKVGARWRK